MKILKKDEKVQLLYSCWDQLKSSRAHKVQSVQGKSNSNIEDFQKCLAIKATSTQITLFLERSTGDDRCLALREIDLSANQMSTKGCISYAKRHIHNLYYDALILEDNIAYYVGKVWQLRLSTAYSASVGIYNNFNKLGNDYNAFDYELTSLTISESSFTPQNGDVSPYGSVNIESDPVLDIFDFLEFKTASETLNLFGPTTNAPNNIEQPMYTYGLQKQYNSRTFNVDTEDTYQYTLAQLGISIANPCPNYQLTLSYEPPDTQGIEIDQAQQLLEVVGFTSAGTITITFTANFYISRQDLDCSESQIQPFNDPFTIIEHYLEDDTTTFQIPDTTTINPVGCPVQYQLLNNEGNTYDLVGAEIAKINGNILSIRTQDKGYLGEYYLTIRACVVASSSCTLDDFRVKIMTRCFELVITQTFEDEIPQYLTQQQEFQFTLSANPATIDCGELKSFLTVTSTVDLCEDQISAAIGDQIVTLDMSSSQLVLNPGPLTLASCPITITMTFWYEEDFEVKYGQRPFEVTTTLLNCRNAAISVYMEQQRVFVRYSETQWIVEFDQVGATQSPSQCGELDYVIEMQDGYSLPDFIQLELNTGYFANDVDTDYITTYYLLLSAFNQYDATVSVPFMLEVIDACLLSEYASATFNEPQLPAVINYHLDSGDLSFPFMECEFTVDSLYSGLSCNQRRETFIEGEDVGVVWDYTISEIEGGQSSFYIENPNINHVGNVYDLQHQCKINGNIVEYQDIVLNILPSCADNNVIETSTLPDLTYQLGSETLTYQLAWTLTLPTCEDQILYSFSLEDSTALPDFIQFDGVDTLHIKTDDSQYAGQTYEIVVSAILEVQGGKVTDFLYIQVLDNCIVKSMQINHHDKKLKQTQEYLIGTGPKITTFMPFTLKLPCINAEVEYTLIVNDQSNLPSFISFNATERKIIIVSNNNQHADIPLYQIDVIGTHNNSLGQLITQRLRIPLVMVEKPKQQPVVVDSSTTFLDVIVGEVKSFIFPDLGQSQILQEILGDADPFIYGSYPSYTMKPHIEHIGAYTVTFVVVDGSEGTQNMTYEIKVKSSQDTNYNNDTNSPGSGNNTSGGQSEQDASLYLKPFISSITMNGLVKVKFDEYVLVPQNYKNFTNQEMLVRILEYDKPINLNFTWNIEDFTLEYMHILLTFQDPSLISHRVNSNLQ